MKRVDGGYFWLFLAVLLVGGLVLQSCAGGHEAGAGGANPPAPPQPTMNHALHLENDLACIDCHDPEEAGDPKIPVVETCFGCHELADEADNVKAYFTKIQQADGSYVFPKLGYSEGLIHSHPVHAGAGVECADCHGEPAATPFVRPASMDLKNTCLSCHEVNEAPRECATCHSDYRKDVAPATHAAAGFMAAHGAQAPADWRDGGMSSCSQCHNVPQDCATCHKESQPASHREIGFLSTHGTGDTDAREQPFEETSCSLCHEETSCVQCHHVQMPRSHTNPFRRRLHGVTAGIDRESCRTCHKQNFCTFCHQTTAPVTHRGNWAETHCIGCHQPLQSENCYVCHKNTLVHLTAATPLPPGPPHDNAIEAACRTCHPNPHPDDGTSCRRCHR